MNSNIKQIIKRRSVWIPSVLLLLSIVFISVLPKIIESQARQWILSHGGESFTVKNIDFNPFTARLKLEEVRIKHASKETLFLPELNLKAVWNTLFNNTVLIETASINGLNIDISNLTPDSAYAGGILLKMLKSSDTDIQETAPQEWFFKIQALSIDNSIIKYADSKQASTLDISHFKLSDLNSADNQKPAGIKLKSRLNTAPLNIEGNVTPFAKDIIFDGHINVSQLSLAAYAALASPALSSLEGRLSIDTDLTFKYLQTKGINVKNKGEISITDLNVSNEDNVLKDTTIVWKGNNDIAMDGQQAMALSAKNEGEITISDLNLLNKDMSLKGTNVTWTGSNKIVIDNQQNVSIENSGKLQQNQLSGSLSEKDIEFALSSIDWQGDIKLKNNQPEIRGQLQLRGITSGTVSDKIALVNAANIQVSDFNLNEKNDISSKTIDIKDLQINLQQKKTALFSNRHYLISGLSFNRESGLKIDSLLQQGTETVIQKIDATKWNFSPFAERITQLLPTAETTDTKTVPAGKETGIMIGSYELKDAIVRFSDQSTIPVFNTEVKVHDVTLSDIDNASPEKAVKFNLNASVDKNGNLKMAGDIFPFKKDLSLQIKTILNGLPMISLSSYTGKMIGYDMVSGELDVDSVLKITAGKIDAENTLKIYQLDVSPLDEKRLKQLDAKPVGALETGLSMLRDKNNTIKLELPVKGTLDDIQVDPGDIINQAISSAVKSGAKTYLAAALFPFGTLLVIADNVSDNAIQVTIDPIVFEPNSINLTKKHQEYLEKISNILKERPEMHVKVCGRASHSDQQAMLALLIARQEKNKTAGKNDAEKSKTTKPVVPESDLINLAEKRAQAVDEFLTKKQGLTGNRLIACKAEIEIKQTDTKPRVDMQL